MSALADRLRATREKPLEVETGKFLTIRRPAETQMPRLVRQDPLEIACQFVVGWDGFTKADIFGAAMEPPDPVAFDADLFRAVIEDRVEWVAKVTNHIGEEVKAFLDAKGEAAKN